MDRKWDSVEETHLVIGLDLVVVGGVSEGKRKHTLLLQVGLVDTGERTGDDGKTTEVARLESSVLTRRALTVVPVTNDNPLDTLGLVVTGDGGDGIPLAGGEVLDLVGLVVSLVDGTDKHVVGDVVQVTTVPVNSVSNRCFLRRPRISSLLQPRTSHGDVVSGSLALGLDQDRDVLGVLAIPRLEGLEDLETVGGGRDLDLDGGAVLGGSLVGVFTSIVTAGGQTITSGGLKLEFLAISSLQGVGEGVEVKVSSDAEGDNQIGRGDKGVGGRVAVVTSGEVTVVRGEDRVGLALLDVLAVPLSDARTTGVGENNTTELLESLGQTVAGDGSANLELVLAKSIKLKYRQGYHTCSDPGVTKKADLAFKPCSMASLAMEAERVMSS